MMWCSPDDAERYQALTQRLREMLSQERCARGNERVAPEDLALYLEWMELAREGAPAITAFVDKSSPHALRSYSYEQLARDFGYLFSHGPSQDPFASL